MLDRRMGLKRKLRRRVVTVSGRRGPARSCASSRSARSQAMDSTSCAALKAAMRRGSSGRLRAAASDAANCAAAPCRPAQNVLSCSSAAGCVDSGAGQLVAHEFDLLAIRLTK